MKLPLQFIPQDKSTMPLLNVGDPEMQSPAEVLTFNCLQDQTVVDAKISDHNPIILETPAGIVCTFNILMQCIIGNNGFARVETDSEYQQRLLGPITQVLHELATRYKVDFFLLQEVPNPTVGAAFYSNLRKLLPKLFINEGQMFKAIQYHLGSISMSGGVFTIYPKRFSSQEITEMPRIIRNICPANQKRFQAFELFDNNTDGSKSFLISNFHGNFKDQEGMTQDIKFLVRQGFIVGGDFNLLKMPELGVAEADALTDPAMQFPTRTYDGIYDGMTLETLQAKIWGCLRCLF